MNIAIILAGGVGNRVGAPIPKQFIKILDKPVIVYTIEEFEKDDKIDAIEVVCVDSYMDYMNELKAKYNLTKIKWIVEGGSTFQESVYKGVKSLEGKVDNKDIVVIHFAASPFIDNEIIDDSIRVCGIHTNAISTTDFYILSGTKHKLTSVSDPDNYTDQYINRDSVACMSTPHAFKFGFINDLYKKAIETGVINEVEPHTTTLMYKMGEKIYFSKGSQTNIKITRKEDLDLFEGYVLMKTRKNNR